MIQKLKTLILSIGLLFSLSLPVLVASAPVYAACAAGDQTCQSTINNQLKCGSNVNFSTPASGTTSCTTEGTSFPDILSKVINVLSLLVGAIAVIMIIVGGFRYVTSAGSESGVQAAKKTIMYALIGLVIVALAQVVVHFVLNNVT